MAKKGYWIRIREEVVDSNRESFYDYFIQSAPNLDSATNFAKIFCQQFHNDPDLIDTKAEEFHFGDMEIVIELVSIKPMGKEEYIQMIMRQDTLEYSDLYKYKDNVTEAEEVLKDVGDIRWNEKSFDTKAEMQHYLTSLTQDELDYIQYEEKDGKYTIYWEK